MTTHTAPAGSTRTWSKPKRAPATPIVFLPKDARDKLVAASKVPDEFARAVAIDAATEYARRKYPQFYL